jgi:hypothetical protein
MPTSNKMSRRALLAVAIVVPLALSASAQTALPAPPTATKKPKTATPQMIDEAVQRSQARSRKERDQRVPEQFGSEEPFTYVPAQTN